MKISDDELSIGRITEPVAYLANHNSTNGFSTSHSHSYSNVGRYTDPSLEDEENDILQAISGVCNSSPLHNTPLHPAPRERFKLLLSTLFDLKSDANFIVSGNEVKHEALDSDRRRWRALLISKAEEYDINNNESERSAQYECTSRYWLAQPDVVQTSMNLTRPLRKVTWLSKENEIKDRKLKEEIIYKFSKRKLLNESFIMFQMYDTIRTNIYMSYKNADTFTGY